ncbi:recombinase family protein [Crocinitomix algicola]|uniref:recombinase family protein n=1 Tax=Crocinitomix algicola TaxID=1740263 RepID=UPI0008727202|nr:recombinase family protein [Crocinitomix algicola]
MSIRDGNHGALKNGYFINKAPYGYKNAKIVEGKKKRGTLEIVPEKAKYIKEGFERVATGIESAESVLISLKKKGLKMSKSNFLRALRKVVYAGKISVPEYKKEPARIVEGKHQGIIDYSTFVKVQNILDSKLGME